MLDLEFAMYEPILEDMHVTTERKETRLWT